MVSKAQDEVIIFSPYLDQLVEKLLTKCTLDPAFVHVVTDLSPASGATDYLGQLRALQALLQRGVDVRTLPRLHAKVLQCDGYAVTLGSQNFTNYARHSHEVTAVLPDVASEDTFLSTLRSWYEQSENVEPALVQRLLETLGAPTKAAEDAHQRLLTAHAHQVDHFTWEQQELELQRFKDLLAASRTRLPQETAFAALQPVYSRGEESPYFSLMADPDVDLTRWIQHSDNGIREVDLNSLTMYPIMLSPSKRMGFARLASSRITYVRPIVDWNGLYVMGDYVVQVETICPASDTKRCNIVFHIRSIFGFRASCRARMLFNGSDLRLVAIQPGDGQPKNDAFAELSRQCREHLTDPHTKAEFFTTFVQPMTFSHLGIRNRNAETFFTDRAYRLGLIEYADTPIILATRA